MFLRTFHYALVFRCMCVCVYTDTNYQVGTCIQIPVLKYIFRNYTFSSRCKYMYSSVVLNYMYSKKGAMGHGAVLFKEIRISFSGVCTYNVYIYTLVQVFKYKLHAFQQKLSSTCTRDLSTIFHVHVL